LSTFWKLTSKGNNNDGVCNETEILKAIKTKEIEFSILILPLNELSGLHSQDSPSKKLKIGEGLNPENSKNDLPPPAVVITVTVGAGKKKPKSLPPINDLKGWKALAKSSAFRSANKSKLEEFCTVNGVETEEGAKKSALQSAIRV